MGLILMLGAATLGAAIIIALWAARRPPPRARKLARQTGLRADAKFDKVWFDAADPGPAWRKMVSPNPALEGEQHYADAIEEFLAARTGELTVERQPDNPYDRNAIAVLGHWSGGPGKREAILGYLSADLAAEIAATRPRDMEIRCVPISAYRYQRGDIDLKVALYEPSVRSGYWKGLAVTAPAQLSDY